MPQFLSSHFSLEELSATAQRGLDNTPPAEAVANLKLLAAETLEPIRGLLGPMHVNSGYRSAAVNLAVGGQPTSQHCLGLACDFVPLYYSLVEATKRILTQVIVFDQLIYEFGSWIHVSHAPIGKQPRMMKLMVGKWTGGQYLPLDLSALPTVVGGGA